MMKGHSDPDRRVEEVWRAYLSSGENEKELRQRRLFRLLPATRRCKFCLAPFGGLGAPVARVIYGKRPSSMNPRICNACEVFAREHQGGAEIELSMLFADVRGSTEIGERLSAEVFSQLINRFYRATTEVLIRTDALIDRLVGDEVIGFYVPGFAGPGHARVAIEAAEEILRVTGHGEAVGPWVPVGAGVHTGKAFVGAVGSGDGVMDITALGDAVNTAARLSSQAKAGEVLVSGEAMEKAGRAREGLEARHLTLKGRSQALQAWVIQVGSDEGSSA